ncbi:unnamed protein product, partial [Brenthis ino]
MEALVWAALCHDDEGNVVRTRSRPQGIPSCNQTGGQVADSPIPPGQGCPLRTPDKRVAHGSKPTPYAVPYLLILDPNNLSPITPSLPINPTYTSTDTPRNTQRIYTHTHRHTPSTHKTHRYTTKGCDWTALTPYVSLGYTPAHAVCSESRRQGERSPGGLSQTRVGIVTCGRQHALFGPRFRLQGSTGNSPTQCIRQTYPNGYVGELAGIMGQAGDGVRVL